MKKPKALASMYVSFPDPTAGVWAVVEHVTKLHAGKK